MNDTSPDIDGRYRRMLLALTPTERVRMASRMFDTARRSARAGIGRQSSQFEERRQMFFRLYGDDIRDPVFVEKAVDGLRARWRSRKQETD